MAHPEVQTVLGTVRGRQRRSVRGTNYFSFQGIPYAEPPVGELRFKPPVPAKPWKGVRDALEEGSPSPAVHMITLKYDERSNEDSLFINVYTPELPQEKSTKLKPVMFWIHGGAFLMGSGHSEVFGPDYLVSEDVILVTFNYRLGVLGFLSLQTPECPGNFGLKDMVAALQWVQANIRAFGGDPGNVTIFGESAGGAAVQYLLLSKAATGLFHKAISQSGATINPWASNSNPREAAFKLGEILGCKTEDDAELLRFMKQVPFKEFVEKEAEVMKQLKPGEYLLGLTFVPVVEPDVEGAFLTKCPRDILRSGDLNDVPYVIGVTTLEGLVVLAFGQSMREFKTDEDMKLLIPPDMVVEKSSEKAKQIVQKIKEFYFSKGFEKEKLVDLVSDVFFINGVNKTVDSIRKLTNRKSPTYLYQFSYDGEKRFMKDHFGFADWKGTCHADELGYMFHIGFLGAKFEEGSEAGKVVESITRLWTDFAKHGQPTSKDSIWKPVTKEAAPCLDINESLTLKPNLPQEAYQLWNGLYKLACPHNN